MGIHGTMSETKLVIFDLDGTIHDSSPGIVHCFRKTGETYGIYDISDEKLKDGLTGPFEINIKNVLDLRDDQVVEAIERYVVFYKAEGQRMAQMFPGIKETIVELKQRGYKIGLATMMVEEFAKQTLHNYGIDMLFDSINGASLEIAMSKYQVINNCIESLDIEPGNCVMIGDGSDDHLSAVKAGVPFIAALYGYGIDDKYCSEYGIKGINDPRELLDML